MVDSFFGSKNNSSSAGWRILQLHKVLSEQYGLIVAPLANKNGFQGFERFFYFFHLFF
jgi:hypothetical protein